jgi:hypothetical protein
MITLLVVVWIFLPWCLHPSTIGGYGTCNVSTCITFYNMPCIVGFENHSSWSWNEVHRLLVHVKILEVNLVPMSLDNC